MSIIGGFDIETTQPYDTPHGKAVRCFLACVYYFEDGKEKQEVFESIGKFVEWCFTTSGTLYCHNLKFEVSYMLPYLLVTERPFKILEATFNIYTFQIGSVKFYCTGNFYVGEKLDDIGKQQLGYGKIEHSVIFPKDHKATDKDIEYCLRDCKITYEIAMKHIDTMQEIAGRVTNCTTTIKKLRKKITNSSMAYSVFESLHDPTEFTTRLPTISKEAQDSMRKGYYGGLVGIKVGQFSTVYSYDIVNCYPSVMINKNYPAGKPYAIKDWETDIVNGKWTFWIGRFVITGLRKHKNTLPTVLRKKYGINEGVEQADHIEVTLCDNDYKLMLDNYKFDSIAFVDGHYFVEEQTGGELFGNYIFVFSSLSRELKEKMHEAKQRKDWDSVARFKAERDKVKIFLNGLYGKFSTRTETDDYDYYIDENKVVKRKTTGTTYKEELDKYYLPIAIWITSYVKEIVSNAVKMVDFRNVVNYDTDSIKTLKPLPAELLGSEMGMWEHEFTAVEMKCVAPKCYAYTYYDGLLDPLQWGKVERPLLFNIKAKGISKHAVARDKAVLGMDLFERFNEYLTFNVLQAKRFIGGTGLIEVEKKLVRG